MADPFGTPTDAQIAAILASRGSPSPLAGYIPQLRAIAARYNVPIAIVLAHLAVESGYGTDDNRITRVYNYWGLTGTGSKGSVRVCPPNAGGKCWDFAAFGSVEEGIQAAISNMGSSGYQGLTLWQYFARYLTGHPDGTSDGAGNNTADYVATALGIIAKLGGTATKDTIVVPGGATGQPVSVPPGQVQPGQGTYFDPGVAGQVEMWISNFFDNLLTGATDKFRAFWTRERLIRIAVILIGAVLLIEGLLFVASPAIFGAAHAVEGAV